MEETKTLSNHEKPSNGSSSDKDLYQIDTNYSVARAGSIGNADQL
jgi:hypothetical protein